MTTNLYRSHSSVTEHQQRQGVPIKGIICIYTYRPRLVKRLVL